MANDVGYEFYKEGCMTFAREYSLGTMSEHAIYGMSKTNPVLFNKIYGLLANRGLVDKLIRDKEMAVSHAICEHFPDDAFPFDIRILSGVVSVSPERGVDVVKPAKDCGVLWDLMLCAGYGLVGGLVGGVTVYLILRFFP
jgi:hypothetical protein